MERRLPHPPAKVWRAITEPEHIVAWFPTSMTISGDRVSYGFGPDGVVTELDPPRVFAHTWGDDHLRWEIVPEGDGCVLVLTHTFLDRPGAASFAAGWHTCVAALLAHLDGRPFTPPADSARLHEDYVAILGLVTATADENGVRVERQLTRPAEEVWRRLDGDRATVDAPPPAPFTAPGVEPGPVTRAEAGKLLEYQTPGGPVRWELTEGTGHGARLTITHPDPDTLTAWRAQAESLAASLLSTS
ncbi:toxin-antitoxin system toxin subunit [Bailinhaonella thermotolerans]|uniref:Toxin-antitoxin system toxin subunit n=2 Tax=Bailinhaonella thermotolerans TaxID=1070861 RepID=A0A3A4A6N4_9ACTN|nr:toxin-antitoxin system toxin subunit [Bailinhaonella thermotolerans]